MIHTGNDFTKFTDKKTWDKTKWRRCIPASSKKWT